jgi:hypothetical protein
MLRRCGRMKQKKPAKQVLGSGVTVCNSSSFLMKAGSASTYCTEELQNESPKRGPFIRVSACVATRNLISKTIGYLLTKKSVWKQRVDGGALADTRKTDVCHLFSHSTFENLTPLILEEHWHRLSKTKRRSPNIRCFATRAD